MNIFGFGFKFSCVSREICKVCFAAEVGFELGLVYLLLASNPEDIALNSVILCVSDQLRNNVILSRD